MGVFGDFVFEGVDVFIVDTLEDLMLEGVLSEDEGGVGVGLLLPLADCLLGVEWVGLFVGVCFGLGGFVFGLGWVRPCVPAVDTLVGDVVED